MITRCMDCGSDFVEVVELGPDLPDLIYASDGTVWGNRRGGGMWWYGSSKAIMWYQLVRMARGEDATDLDYRGLSADFPWGPWVGANYGADHAAILAQLGVPA